MTNGTQVSSGTALPYALVPPVEAPSQLASAAPASVERFVGYLSKANLSLAVFGVAILAVLTGRDPIDNSTGFVGVLLFTALVYGLTRLAVRDTYPSTITAALLALSLVPLFAHGVTWGFFAVLALAVFRGLWVRTTQGSPLKATSELGLATYQEALRSTWGVAGAHVGANTSFGTAAKVGAKGEEIVGEALRQITDEFPFARVFHGVRFVPGRDGADIDHVVLLGNKVFFVDAKNWAYGSYSWQDGRVIRDGGDFKGGEVHMGGAMERWVPYLSPEVSVTSRITLAKREGTRYGGYTITNRQAPYGVTLTTTNSLLEELRAAAAVTPPTVNRRLVYLFSHELQR